MVLKKSMKRNVENPDFGSDSIFFAFPIKRINFWGLQHTCTAAACKNRCIKLIRLFSPGRAVYWVLFVYFGHQSSKKEIDQIGIGRIALWQTNAPFNLMCSHAIFGNTCNMSLLHSSSYCLKNHENISFGFSNLEFPQIWVLWKADFWHENSNIFLSSIVYWDFFVLFSNTVTVPVLKLFGNNNHKLLTRLIHFPKCWKSHHIFPKPIVWFFLQLLHSSLTKDFPFHWGFGWTPCCVIASIKCSKSVEIVGKLFKRANFIR